MAVLLFYFLGGAWHLATFVVQYSLAYSERTYL